MIRISEEGPESEMKEYQQDEKALIKKLQQLHNGSYLLIPKNSADILILGLKNAGKSAMANALQKLEIVDGGKSIEEMSYNEMDCCDEIIK
uniref:Uncharacterized protein n=1 Tax=Panagrolaimus superbus TaxID=310955 RepID=A0A914YJ43_9BILA